MKLTKIAVAAATTTVAAPSRLRCGGGERAADSGNYPSRGHGVDDRVRSGRRQRHHGPHDGRHPPEGRPVPREHRGREPRGRQRRHRLGLPARPVRHGLRHLHDVRLVHHHAAAGRHRLDLRGLHARGPAGHRRRAAAGARATARSTDLRGLGRATPRTRARSSSAASAPSTSTTSCTQMLADAGGVRDRVRALQRGGPGADLAALRRPRRDGLQPGLDPRPDRGRRHERRCCSPAPSASTGCRTCRPARSSASRTCPRCRAA